MRFWRKPLSPAKAPKIELNALDFNNLPILTAQEIVDLLALGTKIKSIEKLTTSGSEYFEHLYIPALWQFMESAQLVPASTSHHHAGPGGLVTHTLDVIDTALRIRRSYNLPLQAPAEIISAQEHIWTYAIFAGAMLHDAGKLICNTRLQLNTGKIWTPHDASIIKTGATHYKVVFGKPRYNTHTVLANGLLHMLPAKGRGWLAQYPDILAQLTAWLAGDLYECGALGDIIRQADGQSVAKNLKLGGQSQRFPNAPTIPLVDRITTALRQLLDEGTLRVNRPEGSAGWTDEHHTYLVCGTVADAVRQQLQRAGATDIPCDNTRLFDTWQEHGFVDSTPDNRAIWHLTVNNRLNLTVLRFETNRLFHPSRRPEPYAGELVVSADKPAGTQGDGTPITTGKGQSAGTPSTPEVDQSVASRNTSELGQSVVTHNTSELSQSVGSTNTAELEQSVYTVNTPCLPESGVTHTTTVLDQSAVTHSTTGLGQSDATRITSELVQGGGTPTTDQDQYPVGESRRNIPQHSVDDSHPDSNTGHVKDFYMDSQDDVLAQPRQPSQVDVTYDMEDPDIPQHFLDWIRAGIRDGKIFVNRSDALVHIVKEGALIVSPITFKKFVKLHGLVDYEKNKDKNEAETLAATALQRKLTKMMSKAKLHRKTQKGLNIHTYLIQGKEREVRIKGWLLPVNSIYGDAKPPSPNSALMNISGFEEKKTKN